MKLLKDKVAIVTGGSRGIGKATALAMAEQGANIAFTDIVNDNEAKNTLAELKSKKIKACIYISDAGDFEDTQRVVDGIAKDFKKVDILINNAGITQDTLLMRMSEEQWDRVIRVNLKSMFNFTKAVQPLMLRQRRGSIINMSSVVGVSGNAGQANYSASKAGVLGFTKSVAKEVGSRNIRVNAIAPGFIITEMTKKLSEEMRKKWESQIPLRRGGTLSLIHI